MSKRRRPAEVVRAQRARERRRRRATWISVGAVILLVLAGVIGWVVHSQDRPTTFASPKHAVSDQSGVANGSGPVVVDLYLDFMCPHCKTFEEAVGPTLQRYLADHTVTLVYHPVAYLDAASTTNYSTRSSAAFACAADEDKFAQFASALFAHQPPEGGPGLSDDDLIQIGGSVGLINPAFARCVRDGRYTAWTRHVTDTAAARGVVGTPTVYVAGRQVESTATAVTAAIDAAAK